MRLICLPDVGRRLASLKGWLGWELAGRIGHSLAVGLLLYGHFYLQGWLIPSLGEIRKLLAATVLSAASLTCWALRLIGLREGVTALCLAGLSLVGSVQTSLISVSAACLLLLPPAQQTVGRCLFVAAFFTLAAEACSALTIPFETLSNGLTALSGVPSLDAGQTPTAIVPYLLASSVVLYSAGRLRRFGRAGCGVLLLSLILISHLRGMRAGIPPSQASGLEAIDALPVTGMLLAMVAGAFTQFERGVPGNPSGTRVGRAAAGTLGLLLALLLSLGAVFSYRPGTRVLILNEGGLDWARPKFGAYGDYDGGMFGLLPLYLRADGFRVNVVETPILTDGHLSEADVFVTINNPKRWLPEERAALRRFMNRGKSVLVLGDHTNVFGLQDGFNTMLAEYGIEFRFDSAMHLHPTWHRCVAVARHPVVLRAQDEFHLGHAVGASLRCGPNVSRLVWAPYSFSDEGVQNNTVGAFLGDYRYRVGERLGDLVLVAWRAVASGKLVVYGDTSAFQNGGLAGTYPNHLLPLFEWLGQQSVWTETGVGRACLAVLLLVAATCALFRKVDGVALALLGGSLALGLYGAEHLAKRHGSFAQVTSDTVLIDRSHIPWTGHYEAGMNSVGPLYTNLHRSNLRTLETSMLSPSRLAAARAVALVAPMRVIEAGELEALMDYQAGGGIVILSVGAEHQSASLPLLHALGLEIGLTPLGTIPEGPSADSMAPRFLDAWPIRSWSTETGATDLVEGDEVRVVYRAGPHVLAVFRRFGQGGTLLVGDSRFFSSRNIQGEWGYWPGNLRFLYHLFKEFLKAEPEAVRDVFPSPRKQ